MLDYEKKLHLDKYWDRMQQINFLTLLFKVLLGVIEFILCYLLFKWIFRLIPDLCPWHFTELWKEFFEIKLFRIDMVYFIGGLIMYTYGRIQLATIIKQNHQVKNEEGNPMKLLNSGCYSKRRHPMYACFVICSVSILFALRSFIGMILICMVIILQYKNAIWEEKKTLILTFGEQYIQYIQKVPTKLFCKCEIVGFSILMFLNILGLFI